MPRPRPLTVSNSRSLSSEYHQTALTPRTPHSRSGRAEEGGYAEVEVHDDDDDAFLEDEMRDLQNVPLLRSSASDSFPSTGYRAQGDDYGTPSNSRRNGKGLTLEVIASRLPIVAGSLVAALLLILLVVSYNKPGTLEKYVGAAAPSSSAEAGKANLSINSTVDSNSTDAHHHPMLISYENYKEFPLTPKQYVQECNKLAGGWMPGHGDYWEAPSSGFPDVEKHAGTPVCSSTITYQLSGDAGLVSHLALIAQAAALARQRNRTFFIEDRFWDRGKWTDHFEDVRNTQPGPEPNCEAPPPEELVACPRLAKHWVINSGTAKFHFGHAFQEYFENPYGHELNRAKPIYEQALRSFTETIRPNVQNLDLISAVRTEMKELLHNSDPNGAEDYIAIHIRRGDHQPSSWKYVTIGEPVPIDEFFTELKESWKRLKLPDSHPTAYIASDSPKAITDFVTKFQGDWDWSTFSLAQSQNETIRKLESPEQYFQNTFDRMYEEHERIRLTRGMIVDLAMLSGFWGKDEIKPQAVICTVPSAICKVSALGFGWNGAFGEVGNSGEIDNEHKKWVEIDEKGVIAPIWKAFNLF